MMGVFADFFDEAALVRMGGIVVHISYGIQGHDASRSGRYWTEDTDANKVRETNQNQV